MAGRGRKDRSQWGQRGREGRIRQRFRAWGKHGGLHLDRAGGAARTGERHGVRTQDLEEARGVRRSDRRRVDESNESHAHMVIVA